MRNGPSCTSNPPHLIFVVLLPPGTQERALLLNQILCGAAAGLANIPLTSAYYPLPQQPVVVDGDELDSILLGICELLIDATLLEMWRRTGRVHASSKA
jgi:hypothetical protein